MAIQLTIVVDTASLPPVSGSTPDNPPASGSTPDNPLAFGHDGAFMMTDLAHAVGGNGTADLHLKGAVGESLQVWASSLSNQLFDEVFIYDFKHRDGAEVLDTAGLRQQTFTESVMAPTPGAASHQPPVFTSEARTFFASEIDIIRPGFENFLVLFLVYGSKPDEGDRVVKGYYQWDPSIKAS